jgi:hypothetical protein
LLQLYVFFHLGHAGCGIRQVGRIEYVRSGQTRDGTG